MFFYTMNNNIRFLFLLIVSSVVSPRALPRNRLEAGLLKVIEKCRDGDVQSLPIALPSLRPLKLPPIKFNYNGYTVFLSDVKVKGLENMSIEKLSASESDLTISMEINIPTLAVRAERYNLQGEALFGMITIDDKGILKANINNLKATADVQFAYDGANTVIKRLNLDYLVDDVQVHLSGSSNIINDIVNDMVSDVINDSSSDLVDKAEDLIVDITNSYLQGYTPDQLINIITSI